ncbi:BTB/POZ and MATH domain-containing protein 4 [Dichanthelium oligosanthes]|uniref:BTB/POZ and MATH domain-containing protein 4 n=1 Tax=Dichanthelium oligosanthes TaxID=888268 RepID=A0A1E5WLZ5_9POAL|nr:BTB/POZ and MATH domain-containing protein 4 [Dichanthelium oligosanthes]
MPAPGSGAADVDDSGSASAIVAGTVTGRHVLHIEGYSRTKEELPNGKGIKSRPFRVGGRFWCIWYYPNGERSQDGAYISVFLHLQESTTETVKARAKFSLLDRAGKPVLPYSKDTRLHEYDVRDSGYGIYNFVEREFLEASEHLKDDCFKIRCDIIIPEKLRTEDRAAAPVFVDVSTSDIFRHLGDLLRSKDGADVAFQIAGETFRAHRCILGARSPVFKAELLGAMRESTATGEFIQIDDMLPQGNTSVMYRKFAKFIIATRSDGYIQVFISQQSLVSD